MNEERPKRNKGETISRALVLIALIVAFGPLPGLCGVLVLLFLEKFLNTNKPDFKWSYAVSVAAAAIAAVAIQLIMFHLFDPK